ncbi:MAG TPA: hypothetical protein VKJ07_17435, partial [Mycobacteriales bacterium]|nr:hypothetical protein [Mycobacteriales bacterium]
MAAVAPASTVSPAISGAAKDGQTLAASTGSWTGTRPLAYGYEWRRCDGSGTCTPIAGATGSTYTATSGDVGSTLVVAVTASNGGGVATAISAQTPTVAGASPLNSTPPAVSGTAQEGQAVTATTGAWTGTTPLSYAYQWRRCDRSGANCTDVTGATSSAYTVATADVGSTLRVVVTAQNAAGSSTAASAPTAVVTGLPPTNTALPTLTGTARDGQTLTASTGTW